MDGTPDILVYPRDRAAYGRLCQLLTRGKRGDDITRSKRANAISSSMTCWTLPKASFWS